MASVATVTTGRIIENSSVVLLARVTGPDGEPVVQADVAGLLLKVYDAKAGTIVDPESVGPGYEGDVLTVADVVYDTLQTDDRWTADDVGYNLAIPLGGNYFPEGDRVYQVEVYVTPAGDALGYIVLWKLTTLNVFGA